MFILDTNVVSELRKARTGKADKRVTEWAETVDPTMLHISVITVFELELGVTQIARKDASQGRALRAWLENQVLPAFAERIFPIDAAIARRCAHLHVPDRRNDRDAYIAATALVHGMTVVTRNVRDFKQTGAPHFNPWQDNVA